MTESYDDRQIAPPLRACAVCGKHWHMRATVCRDCSGIVSRPSRDREVRVDVSGNSIDGP